MTNALCIKCAACKSGTFITCPKCGFDPSTDDELIMSFLLSSDFQDPDSLEHNIAIIRSGRTLRINEDMRKEYLPLIKEVRRITGIGRSSISRRQSSSQILCSPFSWFLAPARRLLLSFAVFYLYQRLNKVALKTSLHMQNEIDKCHYEVGFVYSSLILLSALSLLFSSTHALRCDSESVSRNSYVRLTRMLNAILPDLLIPVLKELSSSKYQSSIDALRHIYDLTFEQPFFWDKLFVGRYGGELHETFSPYALRQCLHSKFVVSNATLHLSMKREIVESVSLCKNFLKPLIEKTPSLRGFSPDFCSETIFNIFALSAMHP